MPDLCVVKDCRSNFAEDLHIEAPVVSVYKFPKDNDLIIKWKKALSLEENWQPSENSSVCEKHFLKSGLTKYESAKKAQLVETAIPTLDKRKTRNSKNPQKTEVKYLHKPEMSSFQDLYENLEARIKVKNWHVLKESEAVCFYQLESTPKFLELNFKIRIIINSQLDLKVLINKHESSRLSTKLSSWDELEKILYELEFESSNLDPRINTKTSLIEASRYLNRVDESYLTPEENIQLSYLKEGIDQISSNFQVIQEVPVDLESAPKKNDTIIHKDTQNSFELCLVEHISNEDIKTEEDSVIIEEYIEDLPEMSNNPRLEIEVIDEMPENHENIEVQTKTKLGKSGKLGKLEIFCCKQCPRKFLTSLKLKFHIKHHHKPQIIGTVEEQQKPQISCNKCENLFLTSKLLKRHQQKEHSLDDPLTCPFCSKQFHFLDKFREHKARCNPVNNYVCQICGKTFNMKKKLDSHVIRHEPNKKQQCPHCEKQFFPGSDLNKHVKRHLNLRLHQCSLCPKSFTQAVALKNHLETHNRVKSKCSQCSKEFSTTLSMKRHLRMYCGKGEPAEIVVVPLPEVGAAIHHKYSYNCFIEDCLRKFALKKLLKKHLESSHSVVIPNFERYCLACKQVFESDNIYYSHVKTHFCVHTCKLCGKGFRRREIVERHELTHAEDEIRSFGCDKCELKFKTDSNLRSHKLMKHSTERQFACKFCEQRFVFSRQLDNHIKVVHGRESKYDCLTCKESFKWLRTFKMHMKKKHDLKEVYGCDKCDVSFGHLNELKLHKHELHGETFHGRKEVGQQGENEVAAVMIH